MTRAAPALAAFLALAQPAAAQEALPENGLLYPQIFLTSDYRFDGLSSSDREPVLQFSVYWWRPDDWYAGLWLSRVDYRDGRNTWLEASLYLGRHITMGDTRLTFEMMASIFPTQTGPGPGYDFVQGTVKLQHRIDALTLNGEVSWTPSASAGAGESWRFEGGAAVKLGGGIAASASYGYRTSENGFARHYWEAGVTWTIDDAWAIDLRYFDTDLEPVQCFYTDWCEAGFAAKITYTLPMVLL